MANKLFENLFNFKEIQFLLAWESLLLVGLSLLLIWISKFSVAWTQRSFSLDEELLEKDNKALAVSFAGYLLAIGIILFRVIKSPAHPEWESISWYWSPVFHVVFWFVMSIILLNLARVINDLFILSAFNNRKEIIDDKNIGTGAVQAGSYLASAFMISVIIGYSQEISILMEMLFVFFYFFCSQIALIVFSKIYSKILPYNLHDAIEEDNPAPGVSFGFALMAMGMIISFPLETTGNIWVLLFWFFNGVVLLLLGRLVLNFFLFKKANLDQEIFQDQNWGIALIEGITLMIIALVVKSSF